MTVTFPFRNLVLNGLYNYFGKEKLIEFNDFKSGKNSWREDYFFEGIEFWKDRLPDSENEIIQIINTSSQETIDLYFKSLEDSLRYIKEFFSFDKLIERVSEWNKEAIEQYEKLVQGKSEEFLKHENRKMQHLQKFEDYEFNFRQPQKSKYVTKINYNFYCINEEPIVIYENLVGEYYDIVSGMIDILLDVIRKYGESWKKGEIKAKSEKKFQPKPVLFLEGEHDITFIKEASKHLGKEDLLKRIYLRQRGRCGNLDKLYASLSGESWETIPQLKIILFDCDTKKSNENFSNFLFKRTIPTNSESIIKRGIENLLPNNLVLKAIEHKKAFVDFTRIYRTKRGVDTEEVQCIVNDDEKKNFCEWICANSNPLDFSSFTVIFDIVEEILYAFIGDSYQEIKSV